MQHNPPHSQPSPPIVLVQTWCQMLKCEDVEPAKHARNMLVNAFGDMQGLVEFVKENNIKV